MDVNHIHRIPSQQHLVECLVESLETVLAKLTQKTDYHSTCQDFSFEKSQHLYCYYCILRFTWICIEIHYMWEQSFLGKREYVFKIFKWNMPSPVVIWGVGFGADLSRKDLLHGPLFWRLPLPHPGERGWGSVTSVSEWLCFLLQVAYALQDWWLTDWWVIPGLTHSAVKSTRTSLSHRVRERWGLFSLLFWPSRSFPELKLNFLWVEHDSLVVSPHVPPFSSFFTDNFFSFFRTFNFVLKYSWLTLLWY